MKILEVNGKLGSFMLNLPESLEEISNDYLKQCTDFIHPNANYALIGVVFKDNLNVVLTAGRKKQPTQLNIVPIFIKAGECESEFIKGLELGQRVVISGSDLSIGNHINSPYNKITPNNVISICEGDYNISKESLTMTKPVCFLEFKLVPASAIHAVLDNTKVSFDNPFVHVVKKEANA